MGHREANQIRQQQDENQLVNEKLVLLNSIVMYDVASKGGHTYTYN